MANITATKQKEFSTGVKLAMDGLKARGLKRYGERATVVGGETYTFYRKGKATAKSGALPTMYDKSFTGSGGDFEKFEVRKTKIYAQEKLANDDIIQTHLDLKSPIVTAITNALLNKEDEIIIEAIKGESSALLKMGTASKNIIDPKNSKVFIRALLLAQVMAKNSYEGYKGVAIAINPEDYTLLATDEYFTNELYKNAIMGNGGATTPDGAKGATFEIMDCVEKGKAYIIPSGSFGYAEWKGGLRSTLEYHETDAERYHIQAVEDIGAVAIDKKAIIEFSFKTETYTAEIA